MTLKLIPKARILHRIEILLLNSVSFIRRLNEIGAYIQDYWDHIIMHDDSDNAKLINSHPVLLKEKIHTLIQDFSIAEKDDINQMQIAESVLNHLFTDGWSEISDIELSIDKDQTFLKSIICGLKSDVSFKNDILTLVIKAPLYNHDFEILKQEIKSMQEKFISDNTNRDCSEILKHKLKYTKFSKNIFSKMNKLKQRSVWDPNSDFSAFEKNVAAHDAYAEISQKFNDINVSKYIPLRGEAFDEDMLILKHYNQNKPYRNLAENEYLKYKLSEYILKRDGKSPCFNKDDRFDDLTRNYLAGNDYKNGITTPRDVISAPDTEQFNKRIDEIKLYYQY